MCSCVGVPLISNVSDLLVSPLAMLILNKVNSANPVNSGLFHARVKLSVALCFTFRSLGESGGTGRIKIFTAYIHLRLKTFTAYIVL